MTTADQSTKGVNVAPSVRLSSLPTYVFAHLDELKAAAREKGIDIIDLGMGNPDIPTPQPIVDAIIKGASDPSNHRYPPFKGKPSFLKAAANWMEKRYNVIMDPETEFQALIGSKEGLAHLSFAYIDSQDYSLVPDIYYPVHSRASWLAGGKVHHMPLTADNNFFPNVDDVPKDIARDAKLLFINYPNNPTAAIAKDDDLEKLVGFCHDNNIILVNDMAYSEICFDDYKPPSILNIPGAKDLAIEFHSFSKSFSMAGWRVGFAVGNRNIIKNLFSVKTNIDYGVAPAIQDGASAALNNAEVFLEEIIATYKHRRDVVVDGFAELGWPKNPPQATMYVWLPIPNNFVTSQNWCEYLIDNTGVVITPGTAFGEGGEGYFRVSLVSPIETLQAGLSRLKEAGISYQ